MGAWDAGHFENDAALDWVHVLCQNGDVTAVRTALCRVLELSQPLPPSFFARLLGRPPGEPSIASDAACEALAAAEIVAFWLGRTGPHFPPYLADWARRHAADVPQDLASLALQAVAAIMIKSELKDLWEEGGGPGADDWHEAMDDLERRLDPSAP